MDSLFAKIKERLENEVQYQQQNANIISGNFKVSGKQARLKMGECYEHAIEIVNQVAEEYEKDIVGGSKKPKYVSIGAYKQVAWERDIAIEQLHELGYDFGQKIDVPDKNVGSNEFCEWIRDNDEFDVYDTKCKNRHVFFEGSPIDNEYEYCPYCGKKIKVVE